MHHVGVIAALIEQRLLPRIVCGSGAGSFIGAAVCTRTDEEVLVALKELLDGGVFEQENPSSVLENFRRLLLTGGWLVSEIR